MKKHAGMIMIILLAIAALALWYAHASHFPLWGGLALNARTLGKIAGLIGMTLFSINMVLSARLKFLEPYFEGLPNIYKKHHLIGSIAFGLLLFHPVFLGAQFLPVSVALAAQFFIPSFSNLPTLFGSLALSVMVIALFITFYVNIAYPRWKFSHQFLGLAFALAGMHVFLIPSDVSRYLPLKFFMFLLFAAGVAAFIYRSLLGRFLVRRYTYIVQEVISRGAGIAEISLSPLGSAMPYRAGQFVFVSFLNKNISAEPHPFSVISKENDPDLRLAVKKLGDFTQKIDQVPTGSEVRLEGAYGNFASMGNSNRDQIWIAGGIGITPFLSMARSLPGKEKIDLYYAVRNEGEAVFKQDLAQIAASRPSFKIIPFFSDTRGRLTAQEVNKTSGLKGKEIYICGPTAMMQNLRSQLNRLGVSNNVIHSEEFALR